ncbi:HDOD domain-containing protein, partial [bacterium]|nr:HDOD domain-containing protein [bacterium]
MSKSSRASSERLPHSARNAIRELLRGMEESGDIPGLPQIVVKLNAVVNDPKSSAADLANVILRDQSLTSRTLKIANSALYGAATPNGVATVTQAVILLGFQNVGRIAQGMAVFNMLDTAARDHQLLRIWMHSIACGVAAERLARIVRIPGGEEAFVAGLLHDVGKLILLRSAPEEFGRILDAAAEGRHQLDVEREVLGFTHQDLGEAVGERWNLPKSLVDVLGSHDRFDESGTSLRNAVVLANEIANLYFAVVRSGPSRNLADIERLASIHLGIAPDQLGLLLGQLRADVDECLEIFGLDEAREARRVAQLGHAGEEDPLQAVYVAMEADIHRKSAQLALLQQISHALVRDENPEHIVPMVLEGLY